MIIIFEGPDNVGKDTQIQMLQSHFAKAGQMFHVLHYSAFKDVPNAKCLRYSKEYYLNMLMMLNHLTPDYDMILNRSHLGEYIYGKMYRQYSGNYIFTLEQDYKNLLHDMYLFVFVDNPKNLITRDDNRSFTTDLAKKTEEISRFETAFKKTGIRHKWIINISKLTAETIHEFVVGKIGR